MGLYGISYRVPRATLVLLHWHFLQIIISGFNWRFFISKETSLLGESIPRIHIAFATIGLILYVFVASVVIYWPYRYGQLMLDKHKRNRLMFGTRVLPAHAAAVDHRIRHRVVLRLVQRDPGRLVYLHHHLVGARNARCVVRLHVAHVVLHAQ
jgi:hypothetical protein